MRKLAILTAIVVLLGTASVASASPKNPHIEDDRGDVDVQHLVTVGAIESSDEVPETSKQAGDIVKAWVHRETADSFSISVEVAHLPNETELSSPIVELWTHFTIKEANFHTRAVVDTPDGAEKPTARYTLHEESNEAGEVTGTTDVLNDTVTFTVAKQDVRAPGEGDLLTSFYVTSHLPDRGPVLDYAPGAERFVVSPDADPTKLSLTPDATYGDDYAFQSFDGPPPSDLSIELTESSVTIGAGSERTVGVTVLNGASEPDTAYLSLGDVPADWDVRLDRTTLTLEPGSSSLARLSVSPSDDASGQSLLTLQVTSDLRADQTVTLSVTAEQPTETGGQTDDGDGASDPGTGADRGGATGAGDGTDTSGSEQDGAEEENGAPGPTIGLVTVTLAVVAWTGARRRRS